MILSLLLCFAAVADDEPRPVSDAPGAVMPTRWWDLEHLHLDLRFDLDAGAVEGTATHRLAPLARPASTVRLHQRALNISEIRVDGEAVQGWRAGVDFVEVPLSPSEPHEVAIDYRATPETGLHFRGERDGPDAVREVWSQGEGEDHRHWFPSWDYPNDRFTFSIDLTARDPLYAIANGTLQSKSSAEPGWTRWSYALDQPIVNYLVAVGVGDYQVHELDGARIPMHVIASRDLDREQAVGGFDRAVDMLPFFDDLLGTPYPYAGYHQLIVQRFLYSGMENTSLTIMARDLVAEMPYETTDSAESVTAHELAHQWFGDLLTCYGWRELWLNEGFATYYTNRWMEHTHGADYAAARRRGMFNAALSARRPMAARSWSPNNDRPNAAVYVRGASVLYLLETHLGRATYDTAIRNYVAQNQDRLVETSDLRRALEDASGEHLGWVFDGWVHGVGAPSFAVRHHYTAGQDSQVGELSITIEQTTEGRPWYAPTWIEIGTQNGIERRKVLLDGEKTTLKLDLKSEPRWVLADPDHAVIARWEQHQRPEQWAEAARHSSTWDGRLMAVEALGSQAATNAGYQALQALLDDIDRDPSVHRIVAESLGKLGTDDAAAMLRALLDDPEWRRREVAADALVHFVGDEQVAQDLERTARSDAHPIVVASAIAALNKVDPERAMALAQRAVRRGGRGVDQPVHLHALRVFGEHGDLSDDGALIDALAYDRPRDLVQAAAYALGNLHKRHADHDRIDAARARATSALTPHLRSPDLRTRQTAVVALARTGDATAAQALRALASTTQLADLADAALDAIQTIRHRDRPTAAPPAVDDLTRLRERLEQAEKRLEQLETWR